MPKSKTPTHRKHIYRIAYYLLLKRKEHKLIQSDIAKLLDVSIQQIQKYESGMSLIPLYNFIPLIDFYKISSDELKDLLSLESKTFDVLDKI